MAKRKSIWVLFGILGITAWVFGSAIQAGAETMNYKSYGYVDKGEIVSVGDVENHHLTFMTRRGFCIFDNGEVATSITFAIGDHIKGAGSNISYTNISFTDGSTIFIKREGKFGAGAAQIKGEMTKGTGRFQGIKGTQAIKVKYLPLEKGEAGPKGIGEGTLTFTLPSK